MKSRKGALFSLLLLSTCTEGGDQRADGVESAKHGLGTVPPSEVATWRKYGAGTVPDERYLQSVAFDETRNELVMFGGMTGYWTTPAPTQDVWEWSPATGAWTERVATTERRTPTGPDMAAPRAFRRARFGNSSRAPRLSANDLTR